MITKDIVAEKLSDYLHRRLSAGAIADWAEMCMLSEPFDEAHFEKIRSVVARLGVADVRELGLTWDECETMLESLGYTARVEITVK